MLKVLYLILYIYLINLSLSFAQRKVDLGILAGVNYYQGEFNQSIPFYSPNFAAGILFRYNIDSRYAIRMSINMGALSGSDSKSTSNYQNKRNLSFSTSLIDYTLQGEFNFFEFVPEDEKKRITPYVAAGFTFFIANNVPKPYQVAIPFGLGYKYYINQKFSIGAEWKYYKTFTDYIDLVSGNKTNNNEPNYLNKQIGNSHQKDWYSLASIFFTYKIKTKKNIPCPAYW
ncbi:MAG: hypothetical protein A2046_12985 [Bacteroidetes bacterium GWA2_30_7]|nr:MAG: hypothetical protein A2046_12985 [Bacteroidetes bacterium GWA2_30_7]